MYRGHEDYDPNRIGAISSAQVAAALVEAGKFLWTCYVREARSDFLMEDQEGRIFRVQCKTGHLFRGAVQFQTYSLRAARRGTEWRRVRRDYQGQIDFFGVYCPDNRKVYLVPIEDVPTTRMCHLRLTPPKNNQRRGIRWARDYEVRPVKKELLLFE
jgi:hypothetical protein